ncbi:GGDEF domain-containing protein [Gynuella sunshinyii]|uniref:diguanylate cyclase n=1 Tax=Gynuella sunshinyii YC6258 TaxID=1445510 RepID=A0A0C5V7E2_9GAMM|nr:diguanylate cyclase [Gynuella sunshinyii]AJQ95330.1 GGDEF domain [Gynuella sunshinyii YC6258]
MIVSLEQSQQHRRDVLRLLLWITFIGGCLFSAVNVIRGLWWLAGLEIVYGLFSLALIRIIRTTAHIRVWTLAYLIPFFSIMMYALYIPNTSSSTFVWILTIPVLSYLLLGRKVGFWSSLVFVVVGIVIYHFRFMTGDFPLNVATTLNITLSSIAMMSFAHIYERNREMNEERLLDLAGTDRLTGLANRMKLVESFARLSALASRNQVPLAVALVDLDFFKRINDQYGHGVGDETLCHSAELLKSGTKTTDMLARLGGEEFALIMLSATGLNAVDHLEEIRQLFHKHPMWVSGQKIPITFSAGVAELNVDGVDLDTLLSKADGRLYLAKRSGRDCVVSVDEVYAGS